MRRKTAKQTAATTWTPFYCQVSGCNVLAAVRLEGKAFCVEHVPRDWSDPLPDSVRRRLRNELPDAAE